MRDTMLLGMACAGGVVISPQLPFIGLPIAAAAATGLAYRGRIVASFVAALIGAAVVGLLLPQAMVFAVPAAAVVLLAVWMLRKHSAQFTASVLTVAIAASAIAADALTASLVGQSLVENLRVSTAAVTELLTQALGSGGSAVGEQLSQLREVIVMLWPAFYVQSAIFGAVFIIAAISWSATRSGVKLEVPAARELDLSVHVLWLLVVGLVALAAAAVLALGQYEQAVRAVGLNALYIARTLFFLQGVAVFSALFDVPKTGYGKMVVLYVGSVPDRPGALDREPGRPAGFLGQFPAPSQRRLECVDRSRRFAGAVSGVGRCKQCPCGGTFAPRPNEEYS